MNETNQNPAPPEESSGLNRGKRIAILCSLAVVGVVL